MDCMQGMKEFRDKYFELAICDPPYGIGIDGQKLNINKRTLNIHEKSMKKELGRKHSTGGVFQRTGACFSQSDYMGRKLLC